MDGKTNAQIKSSLQTAFFGWGVIDEIRLVGKDGEETKTVSVFFSRPLSKALAALDTIEKGETANFNFAGQDAPLAVFEGANSGGGRTSKTDKGEPKKKGTNTADSIQDVPSACSASGRK